MLGNNCAFLCKSCLLAKVSLSREFVELVKKINCGYF